MNKKLPFLTRQIVYAFLVGLILGGIVIGLVDAYAKQPLFSRADEGECKGDFALCRAEPRKTPDTSTDIAPAGKALERKSPDIPIETAPAGKAIN